MKLTIQLLACTVALAGFNSRAATDLTRVFAEGFFENRLISGGSDLNIQPASVAIWAGGNVGSYPAPQDQVPEAEGILINGELKSIRLAQSAFGQMVAGPMGFSGAVTKLTDDGLRLLTESSDYATFSTLTGELQRRTNSWNIRFSGVVSEQDGSLFGKAGQNYFEEKAREAEKHYRAALRIDPFNTTAAAGLMACYHHRMIPLSYAGTSAFIRSGRERLTGVNPALGEIALLETNALAFYERAAAEVIQLANSQPEAGILDGTYAHYAQISSPDLVMLKSKLLDSYARALALQGETLQKLIRLKYFSVYRDPVAGNYNATISGVLAFLDGKLAGLEDQFLLANAFDGLPVLQVSELAKARFLVSELRRLRDSITEGRLAFVASGINNSGDVSSFTYHEYPADYVPFFHDISLQNAQRPSSFENLLARAKELAGWSDTMDERAKTVVRQFDIDKFTHDAAQRQIRTRYYEELGNLCGWIRTDQNELVPDVVLAILPTAERDAQHLYTGNGEARGAIYTQWRRISLSETELSAANQDIQNVLSNMRKKQEIASQIADGQANIAHLILANGEKVAILDREEGEARAAAAKTVARIQAQTAVKSGIAGALKEGISAGVAAKNPWVGIAAGGLSAASSAFQVAGTFQIGEVQAALDRRLADIQSQKTRIAAAQGAAIQFQVRDETLLRTEEAMHALLLEAERLKLNLLMAEQKLDMENLELANMIARVQFLIQEYASALELENSNPLANPDYRLIRDLTLRDAEETFIHAQEWGYLAAKAAYYRVNGTARSGQVTALLNDILTGRTSTRLINRLQQLESAYTGFVGDLGGSQPEFATISLRHDIVQNNIVQYLASSDINVAASSIELAPGGLSSDADWLRFLQQSVVTNPFPQGRSLTFMFSTSLLRRDRNGVNANPLYHPVLFNALIFYDPALPQAHGVRVNLRGRSLTEIPSDRPVRVNLRQAGATYIRNLPATVDPSAIRVWNLHRVRRWKQSDAEGVLSNSETAHLPETSQIFASLNGFTEARGGERLHELSPANDQWVLTIYEDHVDNQPLFRHLDKLVDIEIRFSMRGF